EPQSCYVLFAWVDSDSEQSSGWVAGTVTMSQLFAASLPGQADVSVRVRDVSSPAGEDTIYRKDHPFDSARDVIESGRRLNLGGRTFALRLTRPAGPGLATRLLLITGSLITVLLAAFAFNLLRTRARALRV